MDDPRYAEENPLFAYGSIAEYRADAMSAPGTKHNRQFIENYINDVDTRRGWFGDIPSYAYALAALDSWQEGASLVSSTAAAVQADIPPPKSITRRIRKADQGDDLVMEDVYAGRLDTAWRIAKRDHIATRSREVWISACMGIDSGTCGDVLMWRGVAVLVLADLLSLAGYSVGVLSKTEQSHSHEGNWTPRIEVEIKSPLAPLDVQALAGSLVNPGFYRVLYWHWCASRPINLTRGLGVPKDYETPGAIGGLTEVSNRKSAIQWIKSAIAGIEG